MGKYGLTNDLSIEKVDSLIEKLLKVEKFCEKVPVLRKEIFELMATGEESFLKYTSIYKNIYFAWGVNRGFYNSGSSRTITNNRNNHDGYFWNIYINTLSMYDSHSKFGLADIVNEIDVFYYDAINTTFYATDEQIENLLEALSDWYLKATEMAKIEKDKQRIDKLEKELSLLKDKQ